MANLGGRRPAPSGRADRIGRILALLIDAPAALLARVEAVLAVESVEEAGEDRHLAVAEAPDLPVDQVQ